MAFVRKDCPFGIVVYHSCDGTQKKTSDGVVKFECAFCPKAKKKITGKNHLDD